MQRLHPRDASEDDFFFTLSQQGTPVVCRIHQWLDGSEDSLPLSMVRDEISGLTNKGKPIRFPVFVAQIPGGNFIVMFEAGMN